MNARRREGTAEGAYPSSVTKVPDVEFRMSLPENVRQFTRIGSDVCYLVQVMTRGDQKWRGKSMLCHPNC